MYYLLGSRLTLSKTAYTDKMSLGALMRGHCSRATLSSAGEMRLNVIAACGTIGAP